MKRLAIAVALAVSSGALAQDPRGRPGEPGYAIPRSSSDSGSSARPIEPGMPFRGEVQAIDRISGSITLKHGPIGLLGVSAGTTDYPVKDSAMLGRLKVGDEVRFGAARQNRSLVITNIAPAN